MVPWARPPLQPCNILVAVPRNSPFEGQRPAFSLRTEPGTRRCGPAEAQPWPLCVSPAHPRWSAPPAGKEVRSAVGRPRLRVPWDNHRSTFTASNPSHSCPGLPPPQPLGRSQPSAPSARSPRTSPLAPCRSPGAPERSAGGHLQPPAREDLWKQGWAVSTGTADCPRLLGAGCYSRCPGGGGGGDTSIFEGRVSDGRRAGAVCGIPFHPLNPPQCRAQASGPSGAVGGT